MFLSTNDTVLGIKDFRHFFLETLNTAEYYEALKKHVHEIPLDILEDLVDKHMGGFEFNKPQCDELLKLWHKKH